jgi:hypothetical protein
MVSEDLACIDMEFGHIYGTRRMMVMPVEIGVVLYSPDTDCPRFFGKKFCYDIDVELWRNVTDTWGNTLGVTASVANLGREEYQKPFIRNFRLPGYRMRAAEKIARMAFTDLRLFMEELCNENNVSTLAFFADGMELMAFERADVSVDAFDRVDLQREIKQRLGMKDQLSLDRVSTIIEYHTAGSRIASTHFSYRVPGNLRYVIKPHRALGDAARIFLLSRELAEKSDIFQTRADAYLRQYAAIRTGSSAVQPAERALTGLVV